ncbi:MAG: hypothetical protein JSU83_02935 [Deltaproteobacteria bacterium]|nr:MAG: hypothetical protein JSU83_02935 [Deltaproteobacteria bacterium]
MSFKENLLKKIEIDKLANEVLESIGPPGSERKINKESMKRLLEMSPYRYQRERDLDLFVQEVDSGRGKILVLDNELPIYDTTIDDVAMRKSPYIKEMVSIRNAIKILKDSDVKISTKEDSIKTIQKECIDILDLRFNESDIRKIEADGVKSLERDYADGVIECLSLFAELLGFVPPPKVFRLGHHKIIGASETKESGEVLYGPIVVYSLIENEIKLIDERSGSFDKGKIEHFQSIISGNQEAFKEGAEVFEYLRKAVINQKE